MLLVIILSIPSVQTKVALRVTDYLNESYGTDINIHRLGLNWKGEVDIREVYIADHHQDTLIFAEQVQTNILNFKNLLTSELDFGSTILSNATLNFVHYKDEPSDNLTLFSEKFNTGKPPSGTVFKLFSDDLELENGHVRIMNQNLEKPEILDIKNINITASDFNVIGPEVAAKIESLSLTETSLFNIKDLQSDFAYTNNGIELKNLILETEHSKIIGDLDLNHGGKLYSDFYNDVVITANLKDSELSTNDLNSFYNEFGADQIISINGDIKGTLNDFTLDNAKLYSGSMRVYGDFKFKDLLRGDNSYAITLKNHNITTSFFELRRLMPKVLGSILPVELKTLGTFNFRGNTSISSQDLVTDSNIVTDIGSVTAKIALGNISDFDNAFYRGDVKLTQFNLGKIAGTTSLGKVTADVMVDGRGFTQNTVNTSVDGSISSFVFEGYDYRNILISGNLKNPLFNGKLTIDDPNLKLNFNGLVDVSKDFNQYDFEANVDFAELNKLNLIKRDSVSVFAGKIVMDMDGTTLNNVKGTINFTQTFYQNERDDFYFDDFNIISTFQEDIRTIEVKSPDIINGKIYGEFLVEDIPDLFRNGIGNIYANFIPNEVTNNQYIDYEFVVYNKIIDLFVPELQLGENTRVKGSVSSDESKFKLNFKSPEILLFNNYLGKVNVQIDNDNPLYNTYISVDSVYTGVYDIKDLSVINKTLNDTMYVRSEFKGGKLKDDLFNLSLYHTINPEGKSVVGVKKSDITYKENVWYINEHNNNLNKVVFDDNFKNIRVDSLMLNHNNEVIQMAGVLRDSTYKNIRIGFTDVNVGNLVPPIDSLRLAGNINGKLDFVQKNKSYYPNSTITIDNVEINDIEFGDLNLSISGNEDLTKYKINTSLTNNDVKSISAIGGIDVSSKNPQINLNVSLEDFNMQAFSPFGANVITDIRGEISGNAKVSGNYNSPDILGRFAIQNSGLRVVELNTDFDIEDNTQIVVTKNKLDIGTTNITDTKFNTKGTFSGNATHQNFGDWELNLNIAAPERLLVLNTPPDDEALYYGTAFISGSAGISGPIDELEIDVIATTEEGTTFKIPLSDTESIGDDSFIKFLSPEEKQARISGETFVSKELKGLKLEFDLDINNKAEVEVVVDKVNNSTLKGRGAGTLLIRINTLGAFQMWGDFQVYEGTYDFRYGGVIQKSIQVVPGGNINWDGSPERARLDISAKYATEANPSILLDNPSVNRKIPVEVLVDLKGEIIHPDLSFNVNFPRVSSTVKSELEYKLQNEEQKQKQALFLLASGSFVNDNYESSNAFSGTLVERVSGIVNELFADQDGKFRVGLDYSTGSRTPNQETADRVGITLSTQINERILINGKVGVPVGGVNETAIAGDIEVQWLVNEDGSLRMNFFNRQADLQFIGEDQIFEQGAGVTYSVDFDTFSELVNKLFNKKLTLDDDEELPVTPDDNSLPDSFISPATIREQE
ncbi:translocation/assembly module TamB domain-containing protein [Ulvibacter litoralis]|uniref:translocation/assembly module TamB domain-containing protein n=1 Tax=Ulvibacter litoralis TaxID=227084 RepID=UPI001E5EC0A5|nr:translocation/assembly module TamB domain-containing protein [Ulvibacter litoralis]